MKHLILCTSMMALLSNPALACNWKTDIQKQGSKYLFTKSCYEEVGRLVKTNKELEKANSERQKQVEKLGKTIELKDLALDRADKRIMLWRDETYNQQERLLRQQKLAKYNDWMYFGGGIAVTILSVWAAGQLRK